MNIVPLYCGTYSVGLDKKFHPIPNDGNAEKGALKLSINPFLLRYPDRNVLIDPGLGEFGVERDSTALRRQLEKHRLSEYDITDVVCSHLHYDHIGGLANRREGYWELSFPEARVWASEKEWDKALSLPVYYDEEKSEFLSFVNARANLNFLAEEDEPFPGFKVTTMGGHTEYSMLLEGDLAGDSFLMAGDVLANRSHVNRRFTAKYDYDPKRAQQLREEISSRAFEENRWILAFHSNSGPIFRLTDHDEKQGYTLQNPDEPALDE